MRTYRLSISLGITIIGTAIRRTEWPRSQAGPIRSVIEIYIHGGTVRKWSVNEGRACLALGIRTKFVNKTYIEISILSTFSYFNILCK